MQTAQIKEIVPKSKVDAELEIPGSKSYTNRALMIAALAEGPSRLEKFLSSDDTDHMMRALSKFGVGIELADGAVLVTPAQRLSYSGNIFVGDAGTAMRFLTGFCCLNSGEVALLGDEKMHQRPIEDLVSALKPLINGSIEAIGENSKGEKCPPVMIKSNWFKGGRTTLKGDTSSQYLSSILMIAPYASSDVEIKVVNELTSKPYVDMTIDIIQQFRVNVERDGYERFFVKAGQRYHGRDYQIEGDASSASYFFAAAAITGGRVKVGNVNPNSVQGDMRFVDVLERMGCTITRGKDYVEVVGPQQLQPVDEVDMNSMPDTVQTLAVLAATAQGITVIRGIGNLKEKETDRIKALEAELAKVGIIAVATENSLTIHGGTPHGAAIAAYGDHRMAMSFSVLGLRVPEISILDPSCVSKSLPTFYQLFDRL
ncbi:3-phosphoshikimate 1-carboxyvinyltransferase [Candidatus Woesearchaeota archaeon]|nr:3-phosphoshikimate 1-carboxyvinyltransferase [Candidatus Woesearchaeota archaeon]